VGSRGVLTKRQRQILIGTLLGDAHLELNGKYVRLRVDHYSPQKDYTFWMASEFTPFSLPPRIISRVDKRNGKTYTRWHFSTKSLPILSEFRNMFYKEGKKIVPPNISGMMDNLSLAIWYMDDGFRRRDSKGFYLCTSSFSDKEQKILQYILNAKEEETQKVSISVHLHLPMKNKAFYKERYGKGLSWKVRFITNASWKEFLFHLLFPIGLTI